MRLHKAKVSPKSVTIDGFPITVLEDPTIEQTDSLTVLHVGIFCQHVELNGDTHQLDEATPIYDQIVKETTPPGDSRHPTIV